MSKSKLLKSAWSLIGIVILHQLNQPIPSRDALRLWLPPVLLVLWLACVPFFWHYRIFRRPTAKGMLAGLAALSFLGWVSYGLIDPETPSGLRVFKSLYAMPLPKGWVLNGYAPVLDEWNGGSVPGEHDRFLGHRFETTASSTEKEAILRFYIGKSPSRQSEGLLYLSDDKKREAVGTVFRHLPTFSPEDTMRSLLLVEQIRRGKVLGKPAFYGCGESHDLCVARQRYEDWWKRGLPWAEKLGIDPLAGSCLTVREL
jgi:hypothetical protein